MKMTCFIIIIINCKLASSLADLKMIFCIETDSIFFLFCFVDVYKQKTTEKWIRGQFSCSMYNIIYILNSDESNSKPEKRELKMMINHFSLNTVESTPNGLKTDKYWVETHSTN